MIKLYLKSTRLFFIILFMLATQFVYPIYFKHISMEDGLSQFTVLSIYQDIHGRMWFGTDEGLTVFDGSQINVVKPSSEIIQTIGTGDLKRNRITPITGDKEGNIFFGADNILMKYDIRKQHFKEVRSGKMLALTSKDGEIWCVYNDSILKYNPATDKLKFQLRTDLPYINRLFITDRKQIWIGTQFGLYIIDKHRDIQCIIPRIRVYHIFQSSKKEIWVSSWMDGLYRIQQNGSIYKIPYAHGTLYGISSNQVREITEDNSGNIWIGTFEGLQKYNSSTGQFSLYKSDLLPGSLSHSSVYSLCKDNHGTIWAGTYFGGVNYFNPEKDLFTFYPYHPGRNNCLNNPLVGNMAEDSDGNLWICTEGGGLNCLDRKKNTFSYYSASGTPNALPHNNLKSISYDKKRNCLYIGTHTGGFSRFDIQTKTFRNYLELYNAGKHAPSDIIHKVMCYGDTLIIAARNGTFIMDQEKETFEQIGKGNCLTFAVDSNRYIWMVRGADILRINLKDQNDKKSFPFNKYGIRFPVSQIFKSNNEFIYVGTFGAGIYRLDTNNNTITNYTAEKNQLLSNYCYNITETKKGDLLITTDKGIMLFNPTSQSLKAVRLGMGIPLTAITTYCGVYVCNDNELFVGGTNGMVSFREEEVNERSSDYKLYFTTMYVDNKPVYPNDKTQILKSSLPFTRKIDLTYEQNNLKFEFATSNYTDLLKNNRYEYKLSGFDKEWIRTSDFTLHYTNLNPGSYTLKVRELSSYTGYVPKESSLNIVIHSPWYDTIWAWLLYTMSCILIAYFVWKNKQARMELAMSLREERNEKDRIEKLNQAKFRFFTNISHEFRTPLTLILSHIDVLMQNNSLTPGVYNKIQKIYKHAYRMRNLITELLDFRKLDQQQITLQVSEQDIVVFLKDIYLSFSDYAIHRNISYRFRNDNDKISCWFDSRQLQKVCFNLLSNAFKYTAEGGNIELSVTEKEQQVIIKVIDSGIGISAADKEHIFDRFFQAESEEVNAANPGTGIGLALTKSIVQMHQAEISVESQPGYGSIFIVTLKKGKEHFLTSQHIVIREKLQEPMIDINSLPEPTFAEQLPEIPETTDEEQKEAPRYVILLVEDNEELMQILIALFSPFYKVISAFNGEEGLEKIANENPDLVVSDVMMPIMNGTEMCLRIKNNINLCHIPVVLLSALNSDEQNMEGLRCGADDYIGKPFNANVLLLRCNNLIRNRLFMQNKLTRQDNFDVKLLATNALDKEFLARIVELTELNLDEKSFDINNLAKEMGLGRSSFFTKFKALTGITPNSFILDYKLKKAINLLVNHPELQIAEISDRLGFNTPHYFSKCFKAQFNKSPLEYRKNRLSSI